MNSTTSVDERMALALAAQRRAAVQDGLTPLRDRVDRLRRLESLLVHHQQAFCDALDADFGGRPPLQSRMELLATLESLRLARRHVAAWMRPQRRPLPLLLRLLGQRAEVFYQPLGVVGVVAPWNFPLILSIGPLAGVFAAGNRAMLKPSELSPRTSALMKQLLDDTFAPEELTTWLGAADVGAAFTKLPFDHLLFTGAPSVARHVMRAAAEHLVPVTLELGGKCPAIIGREADWDLAVDRVMWGKVQNAGQICLAPDYVFVPRERLEAFVQAARAKVTQWYPTLQDNPDYCSIISAHHHARLTGYVDEALARGVRVEVLDAQQADDPSRQGRRIAPTLIVAPPADLRIAQDETFGPLLTVYGYDTLPEVVDFINDRPRPLALYYFGHHRGTLRMLKERTTSGGITVNDIASHAAHETLPLGGVGHSGMGRYHGHWGFQTFSHAKAVLVQRRISLARLFNPPYTRRQRSLLDRMIGQPGKTS